ncbi:MAG: hypothetical protein H7X80_06340 [bacterium]|nr:hypothetical protein [Candidatus Kapabacteria bacterium]
MCSIDANGRTKYPPLQLRPFNTAEMQRRGETVDDFSAYGSIIPLDGTNAGLRLLIGNYGGHGLIAADQSAVWWHSAPLSSLTGGFGGLADVDNDGRLELCVCYASGVLVCLDLLTGDERWQLDIGMVASGIVTCDIDGCGRSEFIVATREGILLAVGVDLEGAPAIIWRIDLGYSLGPPVVADFDGDGNSEVLVVSGDGYLYAINDIQWIRARGGTVDDSPSIPVRVS